MENNKKSSVLVQDKGKPDLTGRDRIFSNLLHSWGGYLVVFVAGFLSPRLIDRNLGQMELGIWDFSWSFVNYMKLASLGIGSSINRYVAKYRAAGDTERLNRTVSTVVCLQSAIAALVILLSFIIAWSLPIFWSNRFLEYIATAQWTIVLLGATLAVNMGFDTSRGVITGCHRWDLHNRIESVANVLELIGMVAVLTLGGGLYSLGSVVLLVAVFAGLWRMFSVKSVCPELYVRPSLFHWSTGQEMIRFGLKSLAIRSPTLILVQTTNIIIAAHLGPSALAVFSRSLALVRHVEGFMSKFAHILAPTAGSLQGMGKDEELRRFFLKTTCYGVAFASPLLFFLIIDGDLVLSLWMGERYVHGQVLTILALGYFLPTAQNSVREILKGLNAHGKVGILSFFISGICFLIGYFFLNETGWTLDGAAIVLALSLFIGLGFVPTVYACRKLQVPYLRYLVHSVLPPLFCNIPFVACLLVGRKLFPANPIVAGGVGGAAGMLLLVILYLWLIFPEKGKMLCVRFRHKRDR